jgi:hypothetical protein
VDEYAESSVSYPAIASSLRLSAVTASPSARRCRSSLSIALKESNCASSVAVGPSPRFCETMWWSAGRDSMVTGEKATTPAGTSSWE